MSASGICHSGRKLTDDIPTWRHFEMLLPLSFRKALTMHVLHGLGLALYPRLGSNTFPPVSVSEVLRLQTYAIRT